MGRETYGPSMADKIDVRAPAAPPKPKVKPKPKAKPAKKGRRK